MFEQIYNEVLHQIDGGEPCLLLTRLQLQGSRSGVILDKALFTEADIRQGKLPVDENLYGQLQDCLDTGSLQLIGLTDDEILLAEGFLPKTRLIIFGGGHIAKPLSDFAAAVGFSVTLIDDRPSFANRERFPSADRVICEDFGACLPVIGLRNTDFVVIVTRGHRHDGTVLRQALKQPLAYIGMIGSKRRVHAMMEELAAEGFDRELLAAIKAPIGLDISAVTPEEIAVSILAQLIYCKNKPVVDRFGKQFTYPEPDKEVLIQLSKETPVPRALLTILSAKGSVPRKAGAQMIACLDGRTAGSIGGGCSEAGVVSKARAWMGSGGFFIEHIDLTGDVAEEEGMVCGGTLEVLAECF